MKKILAVLLTVSLLLTLTIGVPAFSVGAAQADSTESYAQTAPDIEEPTIDAETEDQSAGLLTQEEDPTLSDVLTQEPSDDSADAIDDETEAPSDESPTEDLSVPRITGGSTDDAEYDTPDPDIITTGGQKYVRGEAVVLLEDKNALEKLKKEVTVKEVITLKGDDGDLNFAVVSEESGSTEELVKDLSDEDGVESVVPNMASTPAAITKDPYSQYQWALSNTGQNGGTKGVDINPETAWSKSASTKKQCVVAVIDTGIDTTHKDLKSVLWKNPTTKLGKKGNCGYDFTNTYKNNVPKDDDGHGTHVAGIIAASANNNSGISGLNKTGVKIMALKVVDKKTGMTTFARELKAFEYVLKAKSLGVNIKAINCSFGGLGSLAVKKQYDKIFNKLGAAGIVTCVSAGNEEDSIDYKEQGNYYLPASSQSPYCMTVAATDEKGYLSKYSNYGKKHVDIAAPGDAILSTVSYNSFQPSIYSASSLSSLCSYYQGYDYNGTGNFGYDLRNPTGATFNKNETFSISSTEFCGTGGCSMKVRLTNASSNKWYAFELPYNLSTYSDNYSISSMIKCPEANVEVGIYDIPANYKWNEGPSLWWKLRGMWTTCNMNINPYSTSNYRWSTSRRLVFVIYVTKGSSATVYFDHIGVSKQGISSSKFGKLEYMSGTSMACPYVAGAVALVANAYPSLGAKDIINALKNSATKSSKLKSYVNGGRLLNLKNIKTYAKVSYPYAAPSIKTLSNTTAGVRLTIAKVKGASRYRVYYKSNNKWVALGDTKTTTFTHKNAKSSKKYCYTVRCVSSNGKKLQSDFNHTGWSKVFVAAPKPPTLRNIEQGVRITFKKVAGAAKYRIYRKSGSGKWVKLCDTKNTLYIDKTVKRGGTYRYTIRCLNKKGGAVSGFNNGSVIRRVR